MKHIKIFESWHTTEVCPRCNGTGHVGMSKHQSIENILIKGTEKEFLDYIDDADFVENAADLFKKNGVYTVKIAKLDAALGLTREKLQDIIKETNDRMDDMQELLDTGEEEKRYRSEDIEKIKDILKNRAEVLAILRGR
jgi:uncharacterized protein YgfB (UPF0149 family)